MKKTLVLSVLSLPLLLLVGCASIVDGGDKSVRINSQPPGARFTITDKKGKEVCVQSTPAIVTLRRNHGPFQTETYKFAFEAPGYHSADATVRSTINGWYLGNFLFGGFVGMLVDMGTGSAWTLTPRDVTVSLAPETAAAAPPTQDTSFLK